MGARPFTEQEFQSIVATLARLGRHRDKLMVQLGCAVGYRISELLSLRVFQVLTENGPAAEVVVTRRLLKGGHGVFREKVRTRIGRPRTLCRTELFRERKDTQP